MYIRSHWKAQWGQKSPHTAPSWPPKPLRLAPLQPSDLENGRGPLGGTLEVKNLKLGANWSNSTGTIFEELYLGFTMSHVWGHNSLSSPRYSADKTRQNPTKFPTGAQARNFSKSFWAKIGKKFFFQKKFSSKRRFLRSQTVWDPQKPKIGLPDPPPFDPILGHFVGILDQMGVKKRVFFENFFFAPNDVFWVPTWPGTLKNPKLAS